MEKIICECSKELDIEEFVCKNCGLIHDDKKLNYDSKLILNANYSSEEFDKSFKHFGDILFKGKTTFNFYNKDSNGIRLNSNKFRKYKYLWKKNYWEIKIMENQNSRLINIAKNYLRLKNVNKKYLNEVINLFEKTKKNNEIKSNVSLIATCIFVILRKHNVQITSKELTKEFNELGHTCIIKRDLHLYKLKINNFTPIEVIINSFLDNLILNKMIKERYNSKIKFYNYEFYINDLRQIALKGIKYSSKTKCNKNTAIASIYFAEKIDKLKKDRDLILTQKILSKLANISPPTLRTIFKEDFERIYLKYEEKARKKYENNLKYQNEKKSKGIQIID